MLTRPLSLLILIVWAGVMAALVHRTSAEGAGNLATDLARYGTTAQWRGVYYRGEKLGFTVGQTVRRADGDGFELHEDAQLQMSLLGAHTVTRIRTTARVNRSFDLQSFEFALDPGTGPITIAGDVHDRELRIAITSGGRTRTDVRRLEERPMLSLNLVRRLADGGLVSGSTHRWSVFDPATLKNAPVTVKVGAREVVRAAGASIPAARVEMEFTGLRTTAWVTDTGEIVREESPLGFITVRETPERARTLAVPGGIRQDLLEAAAVLPAIATTNRLMSSLDDGRNVRRITLQVDGADVSSQELQGVGQRVVNNVIEIHDASTITPSAVPADLDRYLAPEPLLESDDPDIRAAAIEATSGVIDPRARAEALTRYVSATVQKKPTVGLPSASEVLRTKIGDCNEHTALFVAMARAIGMPARIAVGLSFVKGAFYYHAWPEVYIDAGRQTGYWLPVDPTFNQFPADATHVRLARGGLDKQAAILPLIGRIKITVLDADIVAAPVLVGRDEEVRANHGSARLQADHAMLPPQRRESRWCLPCFLGGHR